MKFVLIERRSPNNDCPETTSWWEQDGDKLYNMGGGWNFIISADTVLETVTAKDWDKLLTPENIAKTSEYQNLVKNSTDKSLKIGWLSPEGKMHYCKYSDHISYVHVVLDSDVPTLEEKGWIHIYKDVDSLVCKHRITQAQARTAREELGLTVFDEDVLSS